MCGIAGILATGARGADLDVVTRMCDAIVHRGPDDGSYYVDGPIGLGQRRLSIIDLAGGRQPLPNEDRSIWITYNGEVYNFEELRVDLEARGHTFRTHCDTEVVVHAYEEYGPECVTRLRGMFAFALWDGKRRQLLLARDRLGKKPLVYGWAGRDLLFGSELQALTAHPGLSRDIDPVAIDEYLTYGYIPAPRTAFRGVTKLEPAHYVVVPLPEPGEPLPELRPVRYWSLPYGPKTTVDEESALEGLRHELREAVRLRLIADVPLGALLSGGVDSSLVVATMSELSDRPVKTFSIGFDDRAFNELPYARQVAQRYGTDHHELIVRPDAVDVLPKLVGHYGEPYSDSSAIPTYFVARLTREHVKVALNGDGGDENFAGYERYLGSAIADGYQRIPTPLRDRVLAPVGAALPNMPRAAMVRRFMRAANRPFPQRYVGWVSTFHPADKAALYTPEFRAAIESREATTWLTSLICRSLRAGYDHTDTMLATDVASYLPYDLLVKMDIASMAASLEARSPFLDHRLMEFAARLPSRFKLHGRSKKYLLKRLGTTLLPADTTRRRKMGFGVPLARWLREDLRPMLEDTVLASDARISAYLAPATVRQLADDHLSERHDRRFQLWSLLWLETWLREFTTG